MAALVEVFRKNREIYAENETRASDDKEAKEAVTVQLTNNRIRKDDVVTELYLSNQNLEQVCSYARFKNLQRLWLNNNKLRSIKNSLATNFCLVEIYLQNNRLTSLTGSLRHLRNLRVLMAQNNQIKHVEKVVAELEKMQDLRILNLFNNPVCQEPDYRSYVIHYIPSVELLDRREVLQIERDLARRRYDQEFESVKETVAFGRRSEGPPLLYHRRERNLTPTRPASVEIGNNFYRSHPLYESEDSAFHARLAKKSTMQFSHFDWASVPSSASRRTGHKPEAEPQIVTIKFR